MVRTLIAPKLTMDLHPSGLCAASRSVRASQVARLEHKNHQVIGKVQPKEPEPAPPKKHKYSDIIKQMKANMADQEK